VSTRPLHCEVSPPLLADSGCGSGRVHTKSARRRYRDAQRNADRSSSSLSRQARSASSRWLSRQRGTKRGSGRTENARPTAAPNSRVQFGQHHAGSAGGQSCQAGPTQPAIFIGLLFIQQVVADVRHQGPGRSVRAVSRALPQPTTANAGERSAQDGIQIAIGSTVPCRDQHFEWSGAESAGQADERPTSAETLLAQDDDAISVG